MFKITLSSRLQGVADFIRTGSIAADIGTDHGQLICYLAQNQIITKGYACDVNQMPLEKAKQTILDCGLEHSVQTVLTNGLLGLEYKGVTDFAIAGMGGELISNIIGFAPWIKNSRFNLVLQPMTRDHKMRAFLFNEGFEIVEEKAVSCGKFLYTIIKARYKGVRKQITPHYAWSGELWDKNDVQSIDYLKSKLSKLILMEPSFKRDDGYAEMLECWKERLN